MVWLQNKTIAKWRKQYAYFLLCIYHATRSRYYICITSCKQQLHRCENVGEYTRVMFETNVIGLLCWYAGIRMTKWFVKKKHIVSWSRGKISSPWWNWEDLMLRQNIEYWIAPTFFRVCVFVCLGAGVFGGVKTKYLTHQHNSYTYTKTYHEHLHEVLNVVLRTLSKPVHV